MSLTLSKILSNPDSILVGNGQHALVITKSKPDETHFQKLQKTNPLYKESTHELSRAEEKVLRELKALDRDVRQHEHKHIAAAGSLAKGAPQYDFQIGPDGKPYAIGGRVRIDTSPVPGDPEASRAKANHIQQAALAPGDPSGPDQAVAQKSQQTLLQNRASSEYAWHQSENTENVRDPEQALPYPLHVFG